MINDDEDVLDLVIPKSDEKHVIAKIKDKLTEKLGVHETENLVNYVMFLVNNCRPRSHIINELEAFFGKQSATDFTKWLWDLFDVYSKNRHRHSQGEKRRKLKRRGRTTESTKSTTSRNSQHSSSSTKSSSSSSKGSSRRRKSSTKHSSSRRRKSKTKRSRKSDEKKKDKRRRKSKSTSRRSRKSSRSHPDNRTSQNTVVKPQPNRMVKQTPNKFMITLNGPRRVGNFSIQSPQVSEEEQSDMPFEMESNEDQYEQESTETYEPSIDDQEEMMDEEGDYFETKEVEVPCFPTSADSYESKKNHTNTHVYPQSNPMTTLQVAVENTNHVELVRCSYWPNCAKGENCSYHHPSSICSWYPNCKFGAQCLNIHPQGGYGRGRGRVRGRGRGRGRGFFPNLTGNWTTGKFYSGPPRGRGAPWRGNRTYYRGRRAPWRGNRTYYRGRGTSWRGRGTYYRGRGGGSWYRKGNMSFIRQDAKLQQACMYGAECTKNLVGKCHFSHPQEEGKGGGSWQNGGGNMSFIRKNAKLAQSCKFGIECTKNLVGECPFGHPEKEDLMDLSEEKLIEIIRNSKFMTQSKSESKLRHGLQLSNKNKQYDVEGDTRGIFEEEKNKLTNKNNQENKEQQLSVEGKKTYKRSKMGSKHNEEAEECYDELDYVQVDDVELDYAQIDDIL